MIKQRISRYTFFNVGVTLEKVLIFHSNIPLIPRLKSSKSFFLNEYDENLLLTMPEQ